MSLDEKDYKRLLAALDHALQHFESRSSDPGFDQKVYDELRRVREALLRSHRDKRDSNLKRRDSRSPSGSS